MARCNRQLAAELARPERQAQLAGLPGTRARLALALRLRLEMLRDHMDTWPQVGWVVAWWGVGSHWQDVECGVVGWVDDTSTLMRAGAEHAHTHPLEYIHVCMLMYMDKPDAYTDI